MTALKAKLRSQRGETLVEVLASILIASVSVAMLLGGVTVSVNLGRQADTADQYFYETLTAAESREVPVSTGTSAPEIIIREGGKTTTIPVQVYGDAGLYSYALDITAGDGP